MAVLAAAIVFAGFAPSYYLKGWYGTPPLPSPLVHLHGMLFTSWIVLLLTQVTLVAARRTDLHRRLGVAGGLLAVVMVVVGVLTAIGEARRLSAAPGSLALVFLVTPLGDMLVFSILVAAAFRFRRQGEAHKRLMLVATIDLLTAAIARLPFDFIRANAPLAFFGLTDLVLGVCVLYDLAARRRVHPAYVWGGLLLVASQPLRLALGGTRAWLAFARWLTG
jgi:hypothetical protein